ncbi:MAG TPA: LuxR C-terminal-related transcriptional regulator [Pseudonocardiaceae bacterium]
MTAERVRVLTLLGRVAEALEVGTAALDAARIVGDERADWPTDPRTLVLAADAAFGPPAADARVGGCGRRRLGRPGARDLAAHEQCGEPALARSCRDLLRTAGAPTRRGRGSSPVPPALRSRGITSREATCSAWSPTALPNAQVAIQLYLSPRTVETHVANLLAKTGTANRGELRAWAAHTACRRKPAAAALAIPNSTSQQSSQPEICGESAGNGEIALRGRRVAPESL